MGAPVVQIHLQYYLCKFAIGSPLQNSELNTTKTNRQREREREREREKEKENFARKPTVPTFIF